MKCSSSVVSRVVVNDAGMTVVTVGGVRDGTVDDAVRAEMVAGAPQEGRLCAFESRMKRPKHPKTSIMAPARGATKRDTTIAVVRRM